MTSNLLRIFGILVLIVLIFLVINKFSTANQPAKKAAEAFMTAFANHDLATVKSMLVPKVAGVTYAGDRITGIEFQEQHVFTGAFSKSPAVKYSYLEITSRQIPRDASAVVIQSSDKRPELATVPLEMYAENKPVPGGSMYLEKVEGSWKVFYIAQPPKETER